MQISHAIRLIDHHLKPGINTWADLGCGEGLFTKALSGFLPPDSLIYAVDTNKHALSKVSVKEGIALQVVELDFVKDTLPLNSISGILMTNSLHFVKDKQALIHKLTDYLCDDGYFLMVEYDTDTANHWVPYPVSFDSLKHLFAPFHYTASKLMQLPSRYHGMMYSAIVKKNSR